MSRAHHLQHVSHRLANVNPKSTPVPFCEQAEIGRLPTLAQVRMAWDRFTASRPWMREQDHSLLHVSNRATP